MIDEPRKVPQGTIDAASKSGKQAEPTASALRGGSTMTDVIMAGQLCGGKAQPKLGPIAPTYQAPLLCEKTCRKYESGVADIERNMFC